MRKVAGLILVFSILVTATAATAVAQTDFVKWHPVIGHEKELVIFLPGGYRTLVDNDLRNYGKNRSNIVAVKKTVKMARLINGTLLLLNYYEANGKNLFVFLSDSNRLSSTSEKAVGGFTVKRYRGTIRGQSVQTHYFVGKDRLYEATAYSGDENDSLAAAFFASVRLASGGTYVSPNAANDDDSTPMPRIKEIEPERAPDTIPFEEMQVDRPAIILFQPSLRPVQDQGMMPQAGRITATALLSSSGTVSEVKTSGNASFELKNAFADTIKNLIFVPAQKDGKLVSVVKKFSWEMTVEARVTGGQVRGE